ncbi:MAG: hypothetical protein GXO43_01220 [Crenarchaeota archaeon]|nr:hypothetical protein [Thermoproteota archaeon]
MNTLIAKSFIEGVHLAVYSSIKPGCYHRLSLDKDSRYLVSSLVSIIDYIDQACVIGEKIRQGELAAPHASWGTLLGKALREAYRWIPDHVSPDIIVPHIMYASILAYTDVDSVVKESGKLRRALNIFLHGTGWRDIKAFIDALRSIHRYDMVDHLRASGIDHVHALESGMTLEDVFRVLGSKWPGFISLDTRYTGLFEYVKQMIEYNKQYKDAESAVVAIYLDLVEKRMPSWAVKLINDARNYGLMTSKEGSKILFNIDLRLKKEKISFKEYIGLIAIVTSLAIYEGLRP